MRVCAWSCESLPEYAAVSGEFSHPVEGALGNLLPLITGPVLFNVPFSVFQLWVFLRVWKTMEAHSGYKYDSMHVPCPHDRVHRFPLTLWNGLHRSMHDFHRLLFDLFGLLRSVLTQHRLTQPGLLQLVLPGA